MQKVEGWKLEEMARFRDWITDRIEHVADTPLFISENSNPLQTTPDTPQRSQTLGTLT